MSDRTRGSVRTESPAADGSAPTDATPAATPPASATQAIPTTGSMRAAAVTDKAPTTDKAPATDKASATGSTAVVGLPAAPPPVPPAGGPTGGPVGAPPVPPVPGTSPAGTPQPADGPDADTAAGRGARGRGPSRPGSGRGPRRARLQLRHIDTWSALKISLVLSIALFFIWMVAVGVLYGVLNALDVFDTLNDLFGQIGSASGEESGGDVVTPGLVFGGAAIIGAINIVLMTALCTVGTFIYNLCSDLVGGLELTLSERD
jgi:hypothetical protein